MNAEEKSLEQFDESADGAVWEYCEGKPFRRKVSMPENWKSSWSDENIAQMTADGGIRTFWEYHETGKIRESWEIDD